MQTKTSTKKPASLLFALVLLLVSVLVLFYTLLNYQSNPKAYANTTIPTSLPNNINSISITGNTLPNISGPNSFSGVSVSVDSTDLTDDNQIKPTYNADGTITTGMHWIDGVTTVTPITGSQIGEMSNDGSWGVTSPAQTVPMYSFNPEDSYLISNIGQTISGKDISLIATVNNTDTDTWNNDPANSRPQGITSFQVQTLRLIPILLITQ